MEAIPQKNGNPIPGQFDYKGEHDCVSAYTYNIPLGDWSAGDELYIAAHAVILSPIEGCYETVWQIGDVEVVNSETGWLENYADEFNWGDPAGPTTAGPSLAQEQPAYTTPFIVGTTPTGEFPFNSNYNRGYATNFDVQWSGALPFGGELTLSWSPGQSAIKKKVVSDGFPTATFTEVGTPSPDEGWFLDTYPLVENSVTVDPIPSGTHTINFQHTQGDGTYWDWILLEKLCIQEETAWDDGEGFLGANWATYFVYEVQAAVVVEGDVWLKVEYRNGVTYTDNCTRHAIFEVYNDGTGFLEWYQTCAGNSWEHIIDVDTLTITDNVAEFSGIATTSTGGMEGERLYIKVLDNSPDFYENWWDPDDIWGYSVISGGIVVK